MLKIAYSLIFWIGYIFLPVTKKTFFYSYASLRRLFVLTNGRFNDFVSRLISFRNKKKAQALLEAYALGGNWQVEFAGGSFSLVLTFQAKLSGDNKMVRQFSKFQYRSVSRRRNADTHDTTIFDW